MSDYDDTDDEDYGILKKALHVELPENFKPDKIPQTGEEYLQHVIYERQKCKTWLTADIDRSKFKNKQTLKIQLDTSVNTPAPSLVPSKKWQTAKIDEFTNFRKYIQTKLYKEPTLTSFDEEHFIEKVQTQSPNFAEVITYSQSAKIRMLSLIKKYLLSLEPGTSINEATGSWLYAILTLLQKPLSPDSCHTLREFAKACQTVRSKLPENASEDLYASLNLFICVVARFYNQLDLADN